MNAEPVARPHPEPVVLNIGGGVGALVVHWDASQLDTPIEISPAGHDDQRQHQHVLERPLHGQTFYAAVFDQTWGQFKGLIHPTIGNHEYLTADAAGRSPRAWLVLCAVGDLADLTATLVAPAGDLPANSRLGTIALAGGSAVVGLVLALRG